MYKQQIHYVQYLSHLHRDVSENQNSKIFQDTTTKNCRLMSTKPVMFHSPNMQLH